MTELKTRKPSGTVPAPLILLEGEEKAGKTWRAVVLSSSDRVGRTFAIDVGEGSLDEYGAIPDASFEIIEHDGSWAEIIGQTEAVCRYAAEARERGELPTVLIVDSATKVWDGLKDWASSRAMNRASNKRRRAQDPTAEIVVTSDLWNDAGARHRRFMTLLLTFPGIVVVTARGKAVAEMRDGQPVEGSKVWRVEGHKELAFDATAWVRLYRDKPAELIGCRSVHAGIVPGRDKALTLPDDWTVEALIFDHMRYAGGPARDYRALDGGGEPDPETVPGDGEPDAVASRPPSDPAQLAASLRERILGVSTVDELTALYRSLSARPDKEAIKAQQVADPNGEPVTVEELFARAGRFLREKAGETPPDDGSGGAQRAAGPDPSPETPPGGSEAASGQRDAAGDAWSGPATPEDLGLDDPPATRERPATPMEAAADRAEVERPKLEALQEEALVAWERWGRREPYVGTGPFGAIASAQLDDERLTELAADEDEAVVEGLKLSIAAWFVQADLDEDVDGEPVPHGRLSAARPRAAMRRAQAGIQGRDAR